MQLHRNHIYKGDCIEVMQSLPAECVDLVFADPPYNLQLPGSLDRPNKSTKVAGVDDAWDQFKDTDSYAQFTWNWLKAALRLLRPTGTIWVIGSYHNIYRVGAVMQDLGFWILNDVVWIKTNPMPNFRGTRFCNAHETLLWAKRSEHSSGYTFNYKALKAGNEDLQMRSDWYFPLCTGPERLKEGGKKVHTTQKPEALLHRIITGCSEPGDIVLDPFLGTGTTAAVAKRLGRDYVGIECEDAYIAAATARIARAAPIAPVALDVPIVPPQRLAFRLVVEMGLLAAGTELLLKGTVHRAVVRADGTLVSGDLVGSIHGVGANLRGAPSCNGWENWMYQAADGTQRSIDDLRQQARKLLEAEGEE